MLTMLLAQLAGSAFACESGGTDTGPQPVWPGRNAEVDVPPDAVFWTRSLSGDPSLIETASGEAVALDVFEHPAGYYAVAPVEALAEGTTYELTDTVGTWATMTVGAPVDPVAPPTPVRRTLQSERWYEGGTVCGQSYPDSTVSSVSYSVCDVGVLLVYAVGDEPAEPTFDDLAGAAPSGGGVSSPVGDGWDGTGAGASTTVWFGSFGPDGSFSGWVSDHVVLPEETNTRRQDVKPGAGASTTPTSWWTCPEGQWIIGELERFAEPADAEDAKGCGCSTTGRTGSAGLLLPLLVVVSRRRR